MRRTPDPFTCLALTLLALPPAAAGTTESVVDGGGAYHLREAGPHPSDEQRAEIHARIAANVARLAAEGRLPDAVTAVGLDWPVIAANGLDAWGVHGISGFVDQDPAYPNQLLDYDCGDRTYDNSSGYNHKGVDIFTWPFAWLRMDHDLVSVVAAAPGIIVGKDDGNPDRSCGCSGNWNAVYVRHADGSTGWYGHMKNGSPTPKAVGAGVVAGEYLGIVGSSGCSTAPHLHFELYDAANALQEPHGGPCNVMTSASWWNAQRPYYDSAVNDLSTGSAPPSFPVCPTQEEPNDQDLFARGSPACFTSYFRDERAGQTTQYAIRRPDGSVYESWSRTMAQTYYPASYWYRLHAALAPAGPDGTWSFEATFQGTTRSRAFRVGCLGVVPARLATGDVGAPYAETLTGSGGTAPYAFALASGALPPGLNLSAGGVISGTPALAGAFGFRIQVGDAGGCSLEEPYTIVVSGGVPGRDLLLGQGHGQPNPNRVRLLRQDGSATPADFAAYGAGQWGVNVAPAALDGSAIPQILTGPGPGPVFGPQVRGFQRDGTPMGKVSFYAYGTLKYGVNAHDAALDADAFSEMLTGPGPGAVFGPHVRGFAFDNVAVTAISKLSYFAYGTLKYGVNVAAGGVDGDAAGEILTGPGPGAIFGPQVRGWDFVTGVTPMAKVNFNAFATTSYGVHLDAGGVDGDAFAEIACAPGPGPSTSFPARFVGFDYDAAAIAPIPGFDATPYPSLYGGRVGVGDVGGSAEAELLCGAGPDPTAAAIARPHAYAGGALVPLLPVDGFPGSVYGLNARSGAYGY